MTPEPKEITGSLPIGLHDTLHIPGITVTEKKKKMILRFNINTSAGKEKPSKLSGNKNLQISPGFNFNETLWQISLQISFGFSVNRLDPLI